MTKDLNCHDTKITDVLRLPDARPPSSRAVLAGMPPDPEKRDPVDQNSHHPLAAEGPDPEKRDPADQKPHPPLASEGPDPEKRDPVDQNPQPPTRSESLTRKNPLLLTKKPPDDQNAR